MAEGSREQHLALCKQRALAYLDAGDLRLAWLSMTADMRKHTETDAPVTSTLLGDEGCDVCRTGTPMGCGGSSRGSAEIIMTEGNRMRSDEDDLLTGAMGAVGARAGARQQVQAASRRLKKNVLEVDLSLEMPPRAAGDHVRQDLLTWAACSTWKGRPGQMIRRS